MDRITKIEQNLTRFNVTIKIPNIAMKEVYFLILVIFFLQRQLGDMKQSSQLRIHQREKEAQELRQAIFSLNVSANTQFGLIHSVIAVGC